MKKSPATWAGWVMSGVPALLLLFSGVMKLVGGPELEEGFAHLGVPISLRIPLGILEMFCVVVDLIPRTAILGAILLTGYMGGAMITHLRLGEPFWMQLLIGMIFWGGIYLREPRLRAILPFRR